MCVSDLCVSDLCVSDLCVSDVCVSDLCVCVCVEAEAAEESRKCHACHAK